jgi:hypothetical protein
MPNDPFIASLAASIVRELRGEWTTETRHDSGAVATRADGLGLFFHDGARVEVSAVMPSLAGGGWNPKYFGVDAETPRATFDRRRALEKPAAVAAELDRRLIAPWEPLRLRCLAYAAERRTERSMAQDLLERLAEILRVEPREGPIEEGRDAWLRLHGLNDGRFGGLYGDVRIGPSIAGKVEFTLRNVSPSAAIRIAELLAELPPPNE